MRVVIFGAAGGTGRQLIALALKEGHRVTAAVRSKPDLPAHPNLHVVPCDVRDPVAVWKALRNQEIVFCALGTSEGAASLHSEAARNLVQAMASLRVRRIVFMSNFGVLGEVGQGLLSRALVWLAKIVRASTLTDHRNALGILKDSAGEWVAVRPMALTNGKGRRSYRLDKAGLPRNGTHIARADVAHFMLHAALSDEYLYQAPAIAY